ncbi:MAG: efflux RND transporter periplasmic adaptor subunit [Gammaproteobacteria bacterium]
MTVVKAEVAPVERDIRLTGTVTSPRSARISTAIAGRVERLDVDAGDRLAAGDLVLALDSALEEAAVARARAALQQAEEALSESRRRVSEAEALVRDRNLPETELKARASEVRGNEALVALRQAELRRELAVLERHEVRAPFDGVISRKLAELGEWVDPGTPVAELVATRGLRVDFQAPQEALADIGDESRIEVQLGGQPDRWLPGVIEAVVPVSDPASRTFMLRVGLPEAAEEMAAGMSANGRLIVDAGRQGVVLPRDALLRYPDGRVVAWVVEPDGTVSERQVATGVTFSGRVEIRGGIEPGETVVLRGNEMLRQGQAVEVRDSSD